MAVIRTVDELVLELLARRVRLLSFLQVGVILAKDACRKEQLKAGRNWAKRIARAGLVESYSVMAVEPKCVEPLLSFRVGDERPNFQELSKLLRVRATESPRAALDVLRLGQDGAKAFAVPQPRRARRGEETHELQLAAVALELESQGRVKEWLSESTLSRSCMFDGVIPDALVHMSNGERWVIECGGIYSAQRLANTHAVLVPQLERQGGHGYQLV